VIHTQYRENYGSVEDPHWKFKGGSTYVVENLTQLQVEDAVKSGCPNLSKLLTSKNPFSEEYIISIGAAENHGKFLSSWSMPVSGKQFRLLRTTNMPA
jgi:hypothetical protein